MDDIKSLSHSKYRSFPLLQSSVTSFIGTKPGTGAGFYSGYIAKDGVSLQRADSVTQRFQPQRAVFGVFGYAGGCFLVLQPRGHVRPFFRESHQPFHPIRVEGGFL